MAFLNKPTSNYYTIQLFVYMMACTYYNAMMHLFFND